MERLVKPFSILTEFDIALFQAGKHFKLYEKLGAHILEVDGLQGTYFAVYAPGARSVCVVGDFNHWNGSQHELYVRWDASGIWEGFIPDVGKGFLYKYEIWSNETDAVYYKTDPFGYFQEVAPKTASIVWDLEYRWDDESWVKKRKKQMALTSPYSIYEVHLGSWKRHFNGNFYSYEELASDLVPYVKELGFTHVELMPVTEFPYEGSWGYQTSGYFAPTSRYGEPQGFMQLVDAFHKENIGVILDWVPSHFPSDGHGLAFFDGTCVYEHPDPRKGYHPDWRSLIFNYGRNEVKSFLISSAIFWLEQYHLDGLRVDAVASMLYLDYSRTDGQWEPNIYGGNQNLDAIEFIKEFNTAVYEFFPDVQTIAEESTAFPRVSHPVFSSGLGFGMKWMMGWMNDTLSYFEKDPLFRKYEHGKLTFNMYYLYSENFILPLSHDEVVHGKASLIYKMPGDDWQKFANLRLLFGYMFAHPGHKLLFMGNEWGQTSEWNYEWELAWHLLQYDPHAQMQNLVKKLNKLYKKEKALHECHFESEGFNWIDFSDAEKSIIAFIRNGKEEDDQILVVCNFTPVSHEDYKIGVPESKRWKEILNTDEERYGGGEFKLNETVKTYKKPWHGYTHQIHLAIPPLGCVYLKKTD